MLDKNWQSENLVFSNFSIEEAQLAKSIFDSNHSVKEVDPTFREWPLEEYESLIRKSEQTQSPKDDGAFYLRKITTKNGEVIGYVQLEFNAPVQETLWLPMLCILPKYQKMGWGSEVVDSVTAKACSVAAIKRVGLNVYAENIKAFKFWFKHGFTQIRLFEPEVEFDREYNCLVLYRELGT